MSAPTPTIDVEEIGARIGQLLDRIADTAPEAGELVDELVRSLVQLHGAGIRRILDTLREHAPEAMGALRDDVLVAGLLELHAVPVEDQPIEDEPSEDLAGAEQVAFIPLDAVRRRPPEELRDHEACQLCSAPTGDDHRHVVDLHERSILCTCRPCGLLFTGSANSHEHFRTVPDRFLRVEPFHLSAPRWASLQIPVGLSFVILDGQLGQPVAFYPSPGGATQSELSLESWDGLVADNPALSDVEPDVEAVLVRNERNEPAQCHIVPVDRCYALVGTLRMHWRGFDGGQEVRGAIDEFFADIDARSRPAAVTGS